MNYSVSFLDGKDGCSICRDLASNFAGNNGIIEPVAVFFNKKFRITDEDEKSSDTCIFHCEKENSIWIENFEEYQEYKRRKEEALKKGEIFNEKSPAIWNKDLVNKFWERIRAYRFAVDYYNGVPSELKHIEEENRELIKFYVDQLKKLGNKGNYYDFKKFIFPPFSNLFKSHALIKKVMNTESEPQYFLASSENFWFKGEEYCFKNNVTFENAKFLEIAYFEKVLFEGDAYFNKETKFLEETYFYKSKFFKEAKFSSDIFQKKADFSSTQFHLKVDFNSVCFCHEVDFSKAEFYQDVDFSNSLLSIRNDFSFVKFLGNGIFRFVLFKGETYFDKVIFEKNVFFEKCIFKNYFFAQISGKTNIFALCLLQINPEARIEIRNLTTKKLFISDLTNYAKNFSFFNLKILSNGKKPSLEIKNSILNKMHFINSDFSEGKIDIEDSSLIDCEFINVNWGKFIEERFCSELFSKKNRPDKARDIFRQLKYAHDTQKDYINANGFYSLEMRAREKSLKENINEGILGEKFLLSIFKWVSNFGQSWLRPLVLLIFSVFFMIYLHTIFSLKGKRDFMIFLTNVSKNIPKTFNYILSFKIDFMTGNPIVDTITIFLKLFALFLIYQIGLAIRRKVRR